MYDNIYDDTNWKNDSNLYDDNCNTGYDENYASYFTNDCNRGNLPAGYPELYYRLDRMEEMLHDMYKERKKHKKKHHTRNKKLKKRLKTVEMQNAYIVQCLASATAQVQNIDKYAWLKQIIQNSAPNIIDLVSEVVVNKRKPYTPTPNQPLYLPDKSRIK